MFRSVPVSLGVAAACLGVLLTGFIFNTQRLTAVSDINVLVVDQSHVPVAGETVVDLNGTFAAAAATINGAPGDLTLKLPTGIAFSGITLTSASVVAADDRVIAIGSTSVWGTSVRAMAVAQWDKENPEQQPSFSFGVKVLEPANFFLSKLNAKWKLMDGSDPHFTDAYVVWASADQTMPKSGFGSDFYLTKDVSQGHAFAGKATLASLLGEDPAEAVDTAKKDVIFTGSLTDDAKLELFKKEKDGGQDIVASAELHLTATLKHGLAQDLAHWLTPKGDWKLDLKFNASTDTPDTSLKVVLSGKVQVNDTSGELGTPITDLDISASFSVDGAGKMSTTLKVKVGQWTDVAKVHGLTLKNATLEFGFKRTEKGVTVSTKASGTFSIGTHIPKDVALSASIETLTGGGYTLKLSGQLKSEVPLGNVAEFVEGAAGAIGASLINAEAHAALDPLALEDLQVSFELTTGAKPVQKFAFGAGLTYMNVGADIVVSLQNKTTDESKTDTKFVLGISPRGDGPALTLGDFDPSLAEPAKSLQLPDLALLYGNQALKGGKKELGDVVFNFLRNIYGCPASDTKCDIDVNLGAGAALVTSVPIPEEIKGITDGLWISAEDPIILGGSFPLFGQGQAIDLFATLPEMKPSCNATAAPADRAPEWFVHGQLELRLKLNPKKGSAEFSLEGDLGVRIRKDPNLPDSQAECGDKTDSPNYDHLEFKLSAALELSSEGAEVTFSGGLKSPDDGGWKNAFGLKWLTIKNVQLELSVKVATTGTVDVGLGFRGAVVVGTKDIDASFMIELKITAAPPWVVPNLVGFRAASRDGIDLDSLLGLASEVQGSLLQVDPGTFPNISLKRIELSFSREDKPELCLPVGLIIGGDLYIDAPDAYLPPDFTTCGTEESASAASMQQTTLGACATDDEKRNGCFSGIRVEVSESGVLGRASMGAWTLGPLAFDDALLELIINKSQQSLTVKGGLEIIDVGRGNLALQITLSHFSFVGEVNLYNVLWARLEGEADFNPLNPSFAVEGFIRQEIGRQINEQLAPIFRNVGAQITIINGVVTVMLDNNQTIDDVAQKIISAPADLQALGIAQPDWLLWLSSEINNAIATYEANNAGVGPLGTIINGLLQGATIQITEGIPGQMTEPACIGTWDGNGFGPANCWTILPSPETRYWACFIVCGWVTVPAFPGIPGVYIGSFCPGIQLGTDCWLIPPITLDLPGLCDAAGIFGINPLAPYNCDAQGLKNKIADIFKDSFRDTFGMEFAEVQAQVQAIADELMQPGYVLVDVPCVGFYASMGDLQESRNGLGLNAEFVIFNTHYYLDLVWDFDKNLGENIRDLNDRLINGLLLGTTGTPTNLCTATDGGDTGVTPPANLALSLPPSASEGSQVTLSGTWDDPSAVATDSVTVQVTWNDGTVETVTPSGRSFSATHTYADDDPSGTGSDDKVVSATVTNSRTGSTSATATIRVQNVAPVLSGLSFSSTSIQENQSVTVSGSFSDAGANDVHQLTISWGDGTSSVPVSESGGNGTFSATHQYRDDNPTGTAQDVYSVLLTLSDDDGGVVSASQPVTVANVAPSVQSFALDRSSVDEGGRVVATGSIADAGTLDTHTAVINWGDGSSTSVPMGQGVLSFRQEHYYIDDNPTGTSSDEVTVGVSVTDDDGGSASATTALVVNNVAPSDVVLRFGSLETYENNDMAVVVSFRDPGIADTYTINIDWGDGTTTSHPLAAGSLQTAEIRHRFLDDNPTGTPFDTFAITVTVSDDDTGVSSGARSEASNGATGGYVATTTPVVTVRDTAPVVRFEQGGQQVQYSDPLATAVVIKAYDVRGSSESSPWTESLSIEKTEWKLENGAFQPGLPGRLSITSAGCVAGTTPPAPVGTELAVTAPFQECSWSMQGVVDAAPGTYTVRVHVIDDDSVSGSFDTTITVTEEDAVAYYVGPTFAATVSAADGSARIPLRATVRDITSVPGHRSHDPYPGDVTDGSGTAHAHIKFVDRDTGTVLCEADARVSFVGDTSIADAACTWSVSLPGGAEGNDYKIGMEISGWYTGREDEPSIVTVSRPLENFVTGGGTLVLTKAAGVYAGDEGSKSSFGFNVKFDPKSRKVHGKATVIVRSGGRTYQIRMSNADTLGIVDKTGTAPRTAQFEGRANLTDITDALNPVAIGGNFAFQMRMTDDGDLGPDSISWTLWDANGLVLFASNWQGTSTVEQALSGGSLTVHGGR